MAGAEATPQLVYGFVGTGLITRAMVEGLATGEPPAPRILLSPRSRVTAESLAERFPSVTVCVDNQAVVDGASVVVLAVRTPQVADALRGLRFAPQQTLVSVVAGFPIDELRTLAAPVTRIVRSIPLPSTARRRGPVVIFPDDPVAAALFNQLGYALPAPSITAFEAFSAATAMAAAHLDQLATIAGWLETEGIDARGATRFVAAVFSELAASFASGDHDFHELADEHVTPGGLNEQARTQLRNAGVPQHVRDALDAVLARNLGRVQE